MIKNKPYILLVEGACGTGKSTVCRELREQMKYVTLMDLNGIGDKTEEAQHKMFKYHNQILDMFDYTNDAKTVRRKEYAIYQLS
jgi:uridine kinase